MPAKNMAAMTATIPSPPYTKPTRLLAKSTRRREMPPVSIRPPANMKKGTAIRGNESQPVNSRCAANVIGRVEPNFKVATEATPREKAIGIPRMKQISRNTNRMAITWSSLCYRFRSTSPRSA